MIKLEFEMKQLSDCIEESELLLDTRLIAAEKFMENQKTTNHYLKPFVVAEQTFAKVRKLKLAGSAECHQ